MTLMRVNIDKTTSPGLAVQGVTMSYVHGLGATPDIIRVRFTNVQIVTGNSNWKGMACIANATNVSIINFGSTTCPDFEVVSIRLHSMIQ